MSILLDAEPLVLAETEEATPCCFAYCDDEAVWSALWSCGESGDYCEPHLAEIRRSSEGGHVTCSHPGVTTEIRITIVTVTLL